MYATLAAIRENCANVPAIVNGTDNQVNIWGLEAFVRINAYCGQDFTFEASATKAAYTTYHPTVILPKRLITPSAVTVLRHGETTAEAVAITDYEISPGGLYLRYLPRNDIYPSTGKLTFSVTGSWGHSPVPTEVVITFYKIITRLAIRDNQDDLRYHNSGFANESWGDGYSYNLSSAELRNLIHPNDVALLWDFQHSGRIVA